MLQDLPLDLLDQVLAAAASHADKHPEILNALSTTCKTVDDALRGNPCWAAAWSAFASSTRGTRLAGDAPDGAPARDRLRLLGACGCMLCGKPRVRKVYWQYRVRCCQACLQDNTVSDHVLKTTHGIDVARLRHLPSNTADLYSSYYGAYSLTFFWKADVERWCAETDGTDLAGAAAARAAATMQEERRQADTKASQAREREAAKRALARATRDEWTGMPVAERRSARRLELERLCLERRPELTPERLARSPTYLRNASLATPMTPAGFARLIERLMIETGVQAELDEAERIAREARAAARVAAATRRVHVRTSSADMLLAEQYAASCPTGSCRLCVEAGRNVGRKFKRVGMCAHYLAVHLAHRDGPLT